jgi:hypothetical protein
MSRFGGMLLFDIADRPIGNWVEDLGGRGMYVKWNLKGTKVFIMIEPYEGEDQEEGKEDWEVWIANEESGAWEPLIYRPFNEAVKFAKAFMRKTWKARSWKELWEIYHRGETLRPRRRMPARKKTTRKARPTRRTNK